MNNKKGVTLLEVMVSLTLISIVMIILMGLLSDLKNEDSLSGTRNKDAINRATIINIIENDFINKEIQSVEGCDESTSEICLKFSFKNNETKKLVIFSANSSDENDYLIYDNEKWELEYGKYDFERFSYCYIDSINPNQKDSLYYFLKIELPVKATTSSKRNYNLLLTSIGKKNALLNQNSFTYKITTNGKEYPNFQVEGDNCA